MHLHLDEFVLVDDVLDVSILDVDELLEVDVLDEFDAIEILISLTDDDEDENAEFELLETVEHYVDEMVELEF